MNLETKLDSRVWEAVRNSFEENNFTGAILDAIYFLSELIREKTGLEADGIALIGQAFGGKSPKIKVNRLQSESDWNIQNGTEQILRGIYQAIRNPRSHEKYTDSEEDARAIIFFLNYLVKIVDKSKTPFSKNVFLQRVLDPDFVKKARYAELLVSEIPKKKRLVIAFEVYRNKQKGDGQKLGYFFQALFKLLEDEEKQQLYDVISEELKTTNDTDIMLTVIQAFPSEWKKIHEVARIRVESKLIDSIKDGTYSISEDRCYDGSFGTWASNIFSQFTLKSEVLSAIVHNLRSTDRLKQDYVFRHFFQYLDVLFDKPSPGFIYVVKKAIEDGDKRFYDAVENNFMLSDDVWTKPFEKSIKEFKEVEPPFSPPISDEEIPF